MAREPLTPEQIIDQLESEVAHLTHCLAQCRSAKLANRSKWKNARRDFLEVRDERDELRDALDNRHGKNFVMEAIKRERDDYADAIRDALHELQTRFTLDNEYLDGALSSAGHPEAIIDAILSDALSRHEETND